MSSDAAHRHGPVPEPLVAAEDVLLLAAGVGARCGPASSGGRSAGRRGRRRPAARRGRARKPSRFVQAWREWPSTWRPPGAPSRIPPQDQPTASGGREQPGQRHARALGGPRRRPAGEVGGDDVVLGEAGVLGVAGAAVAQRPLAGGDAVGERVGVELPDHDRLLHAEGAQAAGDELRLRRSVEAQLGLVDPAAPVGVEDGERPRGRGRRPRARPSPPSRRARPPRPGWRPSGSGSPG